MASRKGGQIRFDVGFNVDKSSLNGLSQSLQNIVKQADSLGSSSGLDKQFKEAAAAASQLDSIIKESWNTKLNQLNLDKLNKGIKDSYGGVDQLKQKLYQAGEQGQRAFVDFSTQILNTNMQLKESSKLLDSMATSMANTVKWGITSGIFNSMTGAIQSAYGYAKKLDTSLNNIRIVTGDSADQMERFAEMANRSAKDLGRSTLDYTKAALSYYQQGLSQEDVRARTETTLKAQNITGIGSEMVDYLTAVWNGFQVSAENAESVVDKLALVADRSASDMSQLAIAMSKVAATANVMGVDIDQLNAQIATVVAVTRQAPESVGTAFKTIYSRLNDIKTGADDAEVSLGNYSGQMATLGFNVLDANGKLRDTGQVMEQIGSRWNTLSKEQQTYLAQVMGGTRQVTQITALFENWTTYSELLNASLNSQGALNEKNAIYMESLAAQLERLGAETERTYSILFDTKGYNSLVNIGTKALEIFNNFIDGLGGGVNVLTYFGSVAVTVFSKQIAQSIVKTERNLKSFLSNASKIKEQVIQSIQADAIINNTGVVDKRALEEQANAAMKILQVQKGLTQEQYNATVEIQKQIGISEQKRINLEKQLETAQQQVETLKQEAVIRGRTTEDLRAHADLLREREQLNKVSASTINHIDWLMQEINNNEIKAGQATRQRILYANQLQQQESNLLQVWKQQTGSAKGFEKNFQQILNGLKNGNIQSQTFLNAWNKIKTVFEQVHAEQDDALNKLTRYLDASSQTKKLPEALQGQKKVTAELNNQINAYEQIGKHNLMLQTITRSVGALGQVLSSVTNTFAVFNNEASTGLDKANAVFSSVQSGISAVGSIFGTAGMGIATVVNGVLSLVRETTGLGDWLEDFFTDATERAQKFNETVSKAKVSDAQSSKQIAELQSIQEEYNTLSEKAGQYGRNIDSLTDDEKNRYYELTDKFTQYNNAVIEGYDEQGHAIVRGQQALQDTIDLLKQAKQEAIAAELGDLKEINKRLNARWETSDEYADTQTLRSGQQFLSQKDAEEQYNTYWKPAEHRFKDKNINQLMANVMDNPLRLLNEYASEEDQTRFTELINLIKNDQQINLTQWQELGAFLNQSGTKISNTIYSIFDQDQINNSATLKALTNESEYWDTFIDLLEQYTQNRDTTDYFAEYKDKIEKLNQQAIDGIIPLYYAGNDLYTMLQTVVNSQYDTSKEYQKLRKKINSQDEPQLQRLISDYIATFTMDQDVEEVRSQVIDYIKNISVIFGNSFLQDTIDDAAAKFDPSKLSVDKYAETLREIIQDIVNTIPNFNRYDDTARQALIDLLSNAFNLDGVKIEIGENATVSTDAIDEQINNAMSEAKAYITDIYTQYGQAGYTIGKSDLRKLLNADELQNPLQILGKVDWAEYFGLKNGDTSWYDALTQVLNKARGVIEEQAPKIFSSLSLDQILDNDDLIKNLTNKKKLNDAEEQYLALLEQQFPQLQKIRDEQNRGSSDYIKYLQNIQSEVRARYKEELEGQQALVTAELERKQLLLEEDLDEAVRQNIQARINELLLQQARLKYQISAIDQKDLEVLKQLQQTEQERLNAKLNRDVANAERTATNLSNSGSALDALRSGQALGSDEAAALAALEQQHTELAEIKNKYSLQYINLLDQILTKERESNYQGQQAVILLTKRVQLAQIKKNITQKENALQDLKQAALLIAEDNDVTRIENTNQQVQLQQELLDLENDRATLEGQIFALETEAQGTLVDGITNMRVALDDFNSAMDTLIDGDSLSTDEWDHLNDILDEVLDKYPELKSQVELLHWEELAGTREYAEAIQDVRDALDTLKFQELITEMQSAYDQIPSINVNVELNEDELAAFQEQLDDFINLDRVIDIQIHSDAEEQFMRMEEEFENLYNAAGMIGENFIVAADDLRELNNVFPGILQNMQLLDDGSYQLNANVVQRAVATAQTVAMQDTAATIEQLQNQSDLLKQKAYIYGQMADAAYVLAGMETDASMDSAQAQQVISKGLADIEQLNSDLTAKKQLEDEKTVGDSSDENARTVSQNWAESSQSGADSVRKFANKAIQAFHQIAIASQAAANGKIGGAFVTSIGIASTYKGASGKSFETSTITKASDQLSLDQQTGKIDSEKWLEIHNAFKNMQAAALRQANDIDGMIATLAARGYDFDRGLNNVRRGQGIKGADSDKSGKSGRTAKTPSSKKGSAKTPKGTKEKTTKEKEDNPEVMEYLEELPDRYHDINLIIKDLTKQLNALEKQQKKLFGKDLIDSLNQQIKLLNQQIKAYQQKIVLAKIEKQELQDSLKEQGVIFDKNTGAIANYEEVLMSHLDVVNATIDMYNALTEEEQKKYKDVVQQVKDNYEDFKKDISRYDEIISEIIPDLQQSIRDARDEQIEKQISKFTMNVEINLDLSQAERDWNQFKKKVINQIRDDDILGNVRSRLEDFSSYYKQGEDAEISALTRQVTRTAEQIQQINQYGTSVFYGDNKAQALEDLKKYSDQLMSSLQDVEDLINDVKQAFFDMVDAAEDAFQEQVKEYEFINKLIDHDKKLIELVYGDQAYDKMNNYYAKSRENDLKELDFQRQEKDFWWQQMQIEKARMEALSKESNEYKQAEERFKALEEQWMSAVESFNSKLEESIEHLLDEYKNNVSLIFQDLGKRLTDGKGLDYIGEEWELINMNADRYLDKINAMYALQELENSYRDAINNSNNNVKAQQALNALMQQQLGMLAEREKISQYDVDRANMLLQVQIQRMALEEARNAKSKLRLRRDAQGNYSYQYTADEDNIAAASQNLAKAQADVYNLDRNKYRQNLDAIYQMQTDFNDKLQALYEEYPVWTQQAEAKKKLLTEQYGQAINDLTRDNSNIRKNLQKSTLDSIKILYDGNADSYAEKYGETFLQLDKYYKTDIGNFKFMTDEDQKNFSGMATYINGLMGKIVPGWTGGIQSLSDKISKQGGFLPTMKDAFDKLNQNTEKYTKDLGKLETTAGTSFKKMSDGLDADIEKTKTVISDNETLIQKYKDSFNTYKQLLSWLRAVAKGYRQIKQAAVDALSWTRALWNAQQKKAAKAAEEDVKQTIEENPTPAPEPDVNPEPAPVPASGSVVQQPKARVGSLIYYSGKYYGDVKKGQGSYDWFATDTSQTEPWLQTKAVRITDVWDNTADRARYWQGEAVYKIADPADPRGLGWIAESQIRRVEQYDTGGYTGSWGSGGRMAMLHEKELVLNKNDTSNLLSAVNIVKTLDSLLSNIGANAGITIPNLIAGTAGTAAGTQNVTIQASFPNATNRFEIEKAFENLLNRASQYVATPRR